MGRPKKEKPNRQDGRYEIKRTVGKNLDGTFIRKSFYSTVSLADCEKQYQEYLIEREVANQTGVGFIRKDVTFTEWAEKWLKTYKKSDVDSQTYAHTYLNAVNNHLNPYFGKAKLSDIKPIDIKAFYATKQNMGKSAISKMRMCLNSIFMTAIDNDLLIKNPARGVKFVSHAEKTEKKVYDDNEIKKVIELARNEIPEIVILLETGIRRGELMGLKWEDLDLKEKTISINRSIADKVGGGIEINKPKWGSYRTNPLSDTAVNIFTQLPRTCEFVFPNALNEPQHPKRWAAKYSRFMKKLPADIPRLSPHELRHTYGTMLRRKDVDIFTIQKLMGHKDITVTTEIYVKNEIDSLRSALKKANL